jgi:hypothetical protein
LAEALMLSCSGAFFGLAVAYWGSRLLVNLITQNLVPPVVLDLRPDWRVLCAAAAAAIVTGILFGVAPAWFASRQDPASLLQQNRRTLAAGVGRVGKALIVAQVALSFVLVMGAGLLVRTFQKLSSIDLGFRQDNLLGVPLSPKPGGFANVDVNAYRSELPQRLSGIPGVRSVAMGPFVPASMGWRDTVSAASVPGAVARGTGLMADATEVTPGFFATIGMSLLRGRDSDWNDDDHHPPVAIVSRSLADRLFPDGSAIALTESWKEDCKGYRSFSESDWKRIDETASCAISIHSSFLTIRGRQTRDREARPGWKLFDGSRDHLPKKSCFFLKRCIRPGLALTPNKAISCSTCVDRSRLEKFPPASGR